MHFYLGIYYKRTEDYEQLIKWFLSSLEINQEQEETHNSLGQVYFITGQLDKRYRNLY